MRTRNRTMRWLFLATVVLAAGILLPVSLNREQKSVPLSQRIPNNREVVAAIRKGLREHSRQLTISFNYSGNILNELTELTEAWMEEALAETSDPTEGDYIRYQYAGYESTSRYVQTDGVYEYTVVIIPQYYTYLVQEEEVTQRIEALMAGFGFEESTSDFEKVQTIYDYVCANVRYDYVHVKHPTAALRSTAYSALKWHTATCQGYSVLLYRMLRMAGLNARIVTGSTSEDSFHAWNLVELDGQHYQLDATWDAGEESYACFLKGTADFADHVLDPQFQTADFRTAYPLARNDYKE
ncbi:MAG: lasso peptide biosynthesis protein [Oscillospiraceae bacterium]|nr:lasso peptide biosynthesis protein [Oscillospiraceae bacterium]